MLKIKINQAKTYLPLKMAKGTMAERMQKARLLNLKFYEELQDAFINNEVAPRTFTQVLRKVSSKDLQVEILSAQNEKASKLCHKLDSKGVAKGYFMFLPTNSFSGKIHRNSAAVFLKETQNFFNEIFNPKIFNRNLAIINNLSRNKDMLSFYNENISGENILVRKNLNAFLSGVKNKTQIDVLQWLRYRLLAEKNTAQAGYQIDRKIEKFNNFVYVRPDGFYSLERYGYDKKLGLLETKIKELIKIERSNISKS